MFALCPNEDMSDVPEKAVFSPHFVEKVLKRAFSVVWVMWVLFCFTVDRRIPVLVFV